MKKFAIPILSSILLVILLLSMNRAASAQSLPQVEYLGEGPGTFTSTLDNFIVKTRPFDFKFVTGPTYEAQVNERVWASRNANAAPPAEWDVIEELGPVEAGCVVKYIGIDDDVDDRINEFQVNGETVEVVTQGLVFSGSFVIPEDGDLTFIARDSVGGWFTPCDERTVTPTPTETASATNTPTATSTASPSPTATNTGTPSPSPTGTLTPTATNTGTPSPTPSPTGTTPPTITATATPGAPTVTPTETRRPRENSCVRINFDVGGQEAARGLYVVQEVGGRTLASWFAEDGWKDSGWFKEIDISFENVYVRVLYYSRAGAEPVDMKILNYAPETSYGWMSWGMCHALEVAWPDGMGKPTGGPMPLVPDSSTPTPVPAPTATAEVQTSSIGASLSD